MVAAVGFPLVEDLYLQRGVVESYIDPDSAAALQKQTP